MFDSFYAAGQGAYENRSAHMGHIDWFYILPEQVSKELRPYPRMALGLNSLTATLHTPGAFSNKGGRKEGNRYWHGAYVGTLSWQITRFVSGEFSSFEKQILLPPFHDFGAREVIEVNAETLPLMLLMLVAGRAGQLLELQFWKFRQKNCR